MSIFIDIELILIFATSLVFGLGLVPSFIILASRLKAYSPVDFRRKNRQQIPLLGGIAVFISTLLTAAIFSSQFALTICLCSLPIILTGFIDDLKELSSKPKLLAQILATTLILYFRDPGTLVLEQAGMVTWAANIVTGFWIIGVTNAFNLVDGMDGEAGGVAFIAAITFAIMGIWSGPLTPFALMLAGSTLAFLFFNWPGARIYLGDAGSTFLGFSLAAIAAQLPMPTPHYLWVAAPMFVIAFAQVDAVLAMYRRARLGISLFKGDHDHIHHRLQKIGLSVRRSLVVIYSVGVYCSVTAIALYYTSNIKVALVVLLLTVTALCTFLGGIHFVQLRLAQQVSNYSQTLIQKYFRLQEDLIYDEDNFSAVVFDLLPYYKELQQRGILIVDSFIGSFSRIIERRNPTGQIQMIGSYSVVLILSTADKEGRIRTKLTQDFRSLLEDFEIVRSQKQVPEGVYFYTQNLHAKEFLAMTQLRAKEKSKSAA